MFTKIIHNRLAFAVEKKKIPTLKAGTLSRKTRTND